MICPTCVRLHNPTKSVQISADSAQTLHRLAWTPHDITLYLPYWEPHGWTPHRLHGLHTVHMDSTRTGGELEITGGTGDRGMRWGRGTFHTICRDPKR